MITNELIELRGEIVVLEYGDGALDITKAKKVRHENGEWYAEFAPCVALNDQDWWPICKKKGRITCSYDAWAASNIGSGLKDVRLATDEESDFYHKCLQCKTL